MFRSAAIEQSNPENSVKIVSDIPTGRCSHYGMCMAYASENPHAPKPGCSDGGRGRSDYCGLATPSWQVAPEGHD
jgi:hypothetical protein